MIFITNESELKIGNEISAIYFYADWLLEHKKMILMIEKIQNIYQDLNFFAIDVDDFKGLCKRFNITSIPTILVMKHDGEEIKRINGIVLTSAFKNTFNDIYKLYGEKNVKKRKKR